MPITIKNIEAATGLREWQQIEGHFFGDYCLVEDLRIKVYMAVELAEWRVRNEYTGHNIYSGLPLRENGKSTTSLRDQFNIVLASLVGE